MKEKKYAKGSKVFFTILSSLNQCEITIMVMFARENMIFGKCRRRMARKQKGPQSIVPVLFDPFSDAAHIKVSSSFLSTCVVNLILKLPNEAEHTRQQVV